MSDLLLLFAMAVAGGVGAAARHVVDNALPVRWKARFPWGTFVVNVTGSFAIGALVALTDPSSPLRTVIGVGLLGGYTTLSTASLETVRLLADRRGLAALANGLGMLIACVIAAVAGLALAS